MATERGRCLHEVAASVATAVLHEAAASVAAAVLHDDAARLAAAVLGDVLGGHFDGL